MSWIKTIPFEEATGKLKSIYQKIKGPNNYLDNILTVHSLRPHTLTGHMSLYKNVLHHSANTFDNWFLELLGSYVSYLNRCDYCYRHHFEGMKRFLEDDIKAEKIRVCIESDDFSSLLSSKEQALAQYAKTLTLKPTELDKSFIDHLRSLEVSDGEILEVNQVVAYFNYANRTVMGLGVNTDNEILGLSPKNKESEDAWGHQ